MFYLVVDGAGAFLPFLPLCFLPAGLVVVVPAAGASADIGAAVFGMSAAIAAAAKLTDNNAVAINLVMGSPAVGLTSGRENTPERRV